MAIVFDCSSGEISCQTLCRRLTLIVLLNSSWYTLILSLRLDIISGHPCRCRVKQIVLSVHQISRYSNPYGPAFS